MKMRLVFHCLVFFFIASTTLFMLLNHYYLFLQDDQHASGMDPAAVKQHYSYKSNDGSKGFLRAEPKETESAPTHNESPLTTVVASTFAPLRFGIVSGGSTEKCLNIDPVSKLNCVFLFNRRIAASAARVPTSTPLGGRNPTHVEFSSAPTNES